MTQYHTFIGIDIGKFTFSVAVHGQKSFAEFENTAKGILNFIKAYKDQLSKALCILETTGGYEKEALYTLISYGYRVHRADTRKVKNFIRSFGTSAKTDRLDALALAKYGFERHASLVIFQAQDKEDRLLYQLVQRRTDLKQMMVAEKNRLQSPGTQSIKESCKRTIALFDAELDELKRTISLIIAKNPVLRAKHKVLKTVPGIGDIVGYELMILLPELGKLDRKKIASLAGLAPIARDSGLYQGYRRTGKGRQGIKPTLFMAAMAARNAKSPLKAFYEKLAGKGKKKMVALTALMRKILVIANQRLKELYQEMTMHNPI